MWITFVKSLWDNKVDYGQYVDNFVDNFLARDLLTGADFVGGGWPPKIKKHRSTGYRSTGAGG
jgi:hypothetical protein